MYADVIVDISSESVDRPFEYIIPDSLLEKIRIGSRVTAPFGKGDREIGGYVINIKADAEYDADRLKCIHTVCENNREVESDLIELARFIKNNYGTTMNSALKCVLPVKLKAKPVTESFVRVLERAERLEALTEKYGADKRYKARLRLLQALKENAVIPLDIVKRKLNISPGTLKSMKAEGIIAVETKESLRDIFHIKEKAEYKIKLNPTQQEIADDIWKRKREGDLKPSLIFGVTGSGKTEIYIELAARVIEQGAQAIILIPEISLTYQTVMRFYRRFGARISVIHSRLSFAQKHDQLEKARRGDVDIIIGPRSALFAPFNNLGLIVIDEEHEGTYQNENAPRYHAKEVAIERARLSGGIVVLGSATPSVETFSKAKNGRYRLYTLKSRAGKGSLAKSEIVDMRQELSKGNRSMISRRLHTLMGERLSKGEQIMLFINRRGFSSFVSCRSCGEAIKCPHCDVSLKYHKFWNGKRQERLVCHLCGYEMPMLSKCPTCGSGYIGTFGTGTQKVEEEVKRLFPDARVLRMDADTTKKKDSYENILSAFADKEADILIGTQMIVKGHDFENVTLVGIIAADLSLYGEGYRAAERTFQLLTQAAGRSGRGAREGTALIQTYSPDNYAVKYGAAQDYEGFYKYEMQYRALLGYPPFKSMMEILITASSQDALDKFCEGLGKAIESKINRAKKDPAFSKFEPEKIGPAVCSVAKINDRFRRVIYIKSNGYEGLVRIKDLAESYAQGTCCGDIVVTFDFSGM